MGDIADDMSGDGVQYSNTAEAQNCTCPLDGEDDTCPLHGWLDKEAKEALEQQGKNFEEEDKKMAEEKKTSKPIPRPRVEGVDYTPEGIEHTRQALIDVRGEAMKQWPEAINFTVLISHVIALLADYKDMRAEEDATIAERAHTVDVPPVYRAVPEMVVQEMSDEPTGGDTDQRSLISRTIQAEAMRRKGN